MNWPHHVLTNSPYKGDLRFVHYFIATRANKDGYFSVNTGQWPKLLNMEAGAVILAVRTLQEDGWIEFDDANEAWKLNEQGSGFSLPSEDTYTVRTRVHTREKPPPAQPVFEPPRGTLSEDAREPVQPTLDGALPKPRGHTAMKEDWQPRDEDITLAKKDLPLVDIDAFVSDFRDYWMSRGKRRVDWDATFRNRVRMVRAGGYPYPKRERSAW